MMRSFGFLRQTAASKACSAKSVVIRELIDQPTTRRENKSTATHKYPQPSYVLI